MARFLSETALSQFESHQGAGGFCLILNGLKVGIESCAALLIHSMRKLYLSFVLLKTGKFINDCSINWVYTFHSYMKADRQINGQYY